MSGPRIVEVIARFGDAVVAARRIGGEPSSSRPLSVGIALVVIGVSLAIAEIATHRSLVVLPFDGAIFGVALAMLGLGAASVGWHRRGEPDAGAFWLGQRPDVDLTTVVPGLRPDERLPVVRRTAAGIELRFLPGMKGTLVQGGESTTLEALAADGPARADADGSFGVPFGDAERAVLDVDGIELTIQPADGVPSPPRAAWLDGRFAVATLVAAAIVGGTLVVAYHVVPQPKILPDQEDRPAALPERPEHPGTFTYPPRRRR